MRLYCGQKGPTSFILIPCGSWRRQVESLLASSHLPVLLAIVLSVVMACGTVMCWNLYRHLLVFVSFYRGNVKWYELQDVWGMSHFLLLDSESSLIERHV